MELETFLEKQKLVTLPPGEPVTVAPTPDFFRWSTASMWTPGPFETRPVARLLLRHRRRSQLDARAAEGTPARLQLRHALVHLDARGLSRALPAVPAPAIGGVEVAQVAVLRAGDLCRRLGALRRRDDDRGRVRPEGPVHPPRTAAGIADPPGPLHRLDSAAHRGPVGRAGRAAVPRPRLRSRKPPRGARPSAARSTRRTWCIPSASSCCRSCDRTSRPSRATASRCAASTTRC